MGNTDTFEFQPTNFDMDSKECSTMIKLELSEVGDPVPFKMIKLEQDGEPTIFQMEVSFQSEWITDSIGNQAGPSNIGNQEPTKEPHSSSSSAPLKRTRTDTKSSDGGPYKRPKHRLRLENNESMEIMSSDDDAFSFDSDMEDGKDSESDSEREYFSDDDTLSTGNQDDQELVGANSDNDSDNFEPRSKTRVQKPDPPPVWTTEEKSMKKFEFTKKRELRIPPPKEPYEAFRWFLNDQVLDTIVNETNKYAALTCYKQTVAPKSRLRAWKDVTRDEMITFLALLMHTGTIRTNRLTDYWKRDYLFNLSCFSSFMTRNRFLLILNCLTFGFPDPDTRKKDNVAKIRPIIKNFNEKMNEIYYPGKELTIAKSMVFWHGHLVRQEYTDHRRHKNAINLFMLAEPNGTVVKYQVYAGNSYDNIYKVTTGEIVKELMEDKLGNGHSVYMDRYYSSYKLALKLLECQTYCTGTLNKKTRDNPFRQIPYNLCRLTNKSFFSNGVHIGKWRDTKSTLYITTEFKNEFKLFMETNGIQRNKPEALANYSKFMTGDELQDQLMSYQPCSRKSMRWYKKLFIHSLQIYMSNAFHLFNNYSVKKKLSYYEFRLSVLKAMLPEPKKTLVAPPMSLLSNHVLRKITTTKLREKKNKDGTVRIVNEVVRKQCKPCRRKKKRVSTLYECAACEGSPAFCTTCFCEAHATDKMTV